MISGKISAGAIARFALLFLIAALQACATSSPPPRAEGAAPDFKLVDTHGNVVSLSAFQGSYVLVHFWATWCSSCIQEMGSLNNLYRVNEPGGLRVLAVAVDSPPEAVEKFARENQVLFPVLNDVDGHVRDAYGVSGVPETFLLNRQNTLIPIKDVMSGKAMPSIQGPRDWDDGLSAIYFSELIQR
jgi:peroxiredoxin